jgi:DNA-binding transcriptional MerR regulator
VTTDGLLSIGAFGMLSGLSINALRHYDELSTTRPRYTPCCNGIGNDCS